MVEFIGLFIAIPVFFRAPTILALFLSLFALDLYILELFHIDYAHLLGFKKSAITGKSLLTGSSFFSVFLFINLYLYNDVADHDDHNYLVDLIPLSFYISLTMIIFWPSESFLGGQRWYLITTLLKVVTPNKQTGVSFGEVFIADGLTSLSKVFADLEVIACIILSHLSRHEVFNAFPGCVHSFVLPTVISLPYIFRMRQCYVQFKHTGDAYPHMLNFLKYSSSLPAIWTGFLRNYDPTSNYDIFFYFLWLTFSLINTLFSFCWDLTMDWGLGDPRAPHKYLRKEITFPAVWYYVAMFLDLLLRWAWSLQLSSLIHFSSEELTLLFEIGEISRRSMWNVFRIEWEHVKNKKPPSRSRYSLNNVVPMGAPDDQQPLETELSRISDRMLTHASSNVSVTSSTGISEVEDGLFVTHAHHRS